jgi:hypothetical protein
MHLSKPIKKSVLLDTIRNVIFLIGSSHDQPREAETLVPDVS